jgi:hypothetical protein
MQLVSITIESNSRLIKIEDEAFSGSGLTTIMIPSSVEVIGRCCFKYCKSLVSVTIEPNSRLTRIEEQTFCGSGDTDYDSIIG